MDEEEELDVELTDLQKKALIKVAEHLSILSERMDKEPIDPKISALLQMAEDCIREQVAFSKYYPRFYETNNNKMFRFLDNDAEDTGPTVEELNSWFFKETNEEDNGTIGDTE